jgi:hypothetical protein
MNLLEQAKRAVKAARDFGPANGEHYTEAEVSTLNELCKQAFLACRDANTSIGAMRLALYRQERQEHQQRLERICAEFKAAALEQTGRGAA